METKRLEGKVAFITGAARGQGRAHCVRLASEGAKIIATDICKQIESVPYSLASRDDLAETEELVRKEGQEVVAFECDVRDRASLDSALARGIEAFGSVDILCANAGILAILTEGAPMQSWHDSIDVMLLGVFNTIEAIVPTMAEQGRGGSVILTGSQGAMTGLCSSPSGATPGLLAYMASKHGVVALMKAYANAYGSHGIRVNVVHPGTVNTVMANEPKLHAWFATQPNMPRSRESPIPVPWIEADQIADSVSWLASDDSRFVTGLEVFVDAGRHLA
jgi:SDR family mycofactocin-dependent oxidoreductase